MTWPGPQKSIEGLADRYGSDVVIAACVDLLAGREVDGQLVVGLGGPPARWAVDGGEPGPDYWLRVWALRGLLWVWSDRATTAVMAALSDDAWRAREMAARVAGRNRIDEARTPLLALRNDPVARVRAAASKALDRISS